MRERPVCRCPLCLTDRALRAELADSADQISRYVELRSLPHLATFDSAATLLSHLQSSKPDSATDLILSELLAAKTEFPNSVAETLLVLLFLPVLHVTVRRVCRYYPALSREDTAQQALGFLLDHLNSPQLRTRCTYLAFAIARQVRRSTFVWAAKEAGSSQWNQLHRREEIYLYESAAESFENVALLHHFLDRALFEGTLRSAELDLLIQFKLEGGAENGAFSNAERQRLKRLVAKLRTRANGRHRSRH